MSFSKKEPDVISRVSLKDESSEEQGGQPDGELRHEPEEESKGEPGDSEAADGDPLM